MARLAAQVKLEFFPTPPRVVEGIAALLTFPSDCFAHARLLDPCAGDGRALALLAQRLKACFQPACGDETSCSLSTWGIEIQTSLARQARSRLDRVLHGNFFQTTLSWAGWQLAYLNPPYDWDQTSARRLESTFLQRTSRLLCAEGVLIFIIPQWVLREREVAGYLATQYDQLVCFRFPAPEYEQFKQVVLLARRRRTPLPVGAVAGELEQLRDWARAGKDIPVLPEASALARGGPRWSLPRCPTGEHPCFYLGHFEPDRLARQLCWESQTARPLAGVWANRDWWQLHVSLAASGGQEASSGWSPLHAFKPIHLTLLAAAGLADRTLIQVDGERLLLKGQTWKDQVVSVEETPEEMIEKRSDVFIGSLQALDLETGELLLIHPPGREAPLPAGVDLRQVRHQHVVLTTFLKRYGAVLLQAIQQRYPPRFVSEAQVPWAEAAFSQLQRVPLGKQRETILAHVMAFTRSPSPLRRQLLSAEMGSGKTFMAIASAFASDLYACGTWTSVPRSYQALHLFPALVCCPPILAGKWKRELEETLPPRARVLIVEPVAPVPRQAQHQGREVEAEGARTALEDYRRFDPSFTGTRLGRIECLDRAVACIRRDLAAWRQHVRAAQRQSSPLPPKPIHVLILTTSDAKLGGPWQPAWHGLPLRTAKARGGEQVSQVTLVRDAEGRSIRVPACPSCFRPLLAQSSRVRAWSPSARPAAPALLAWHQLQERYEEAGRAAGEALQTARERLEEYLWKLPEYRQLGEDEQRYRIGGLPPGESDPELTTLLDGILEHLREHTVDKATQPGGLLQQGERLNQCLNQYLLACQTCQRLACQLDGLLRERELACRTHKEALREQLARQDPSYQQLLREHETALMARLHQPGRPTLVEELASLPHEKLASEEQVGKPDGRIKYRCCFCGEGAWQARAMGQRQRYPLADYLRRRYRGLFGLLIADEAHEGGNGTALEQARQSLMEACRASLLLTGTLSNGFASSLFHPSYLLLPEVRRQFGWEDEQRWISRFGCLQRVRKSRREEAEADGVLSRRRIRLGMPVIKEIPGFSPEGIVLLTRVGSFTELREVVPDLVPYRERVLLVPLGRPLGPAYHAFERQITQVLRGLLASGDRSALAPWLQALLLYPLFPWREWSCSTRHGTVLGTAPALPGEQCYPLEEQLLSLVQRARQDAPVLVYCGETGHYDLLPRLKRLLEQQLRRPDGQPLRVALLRADTVAPVDREAWLWRLLRAEGVDVLLTNPRLVKVGLDLLAFRRIIYFSFPASVADLRQSARRSWRPGQTGDVEVTFLAYEQTMSERLLRHLARKARQALLVEAMEFGSTEEGLVALGSEGEEEEQEGLLMTLARETFALLEAHDAQPSQLTSVTGLDDPAQEQPCQEAAPRETPGDATLPALAPVQTPPTPSEERTWAPLPVGDVVLLPLPFEDLPLAPLSLPTKRTKALRRPRRR
ncbi:DUF6094 domain-containing protein [Thermogemmatispora tikiterensis]|uniref:Helicase C-terminal domain-containing protein n=1 Tax=Thermogemmatispora tikiterensis TaxID=1825093 RepID=A0A328VG35_9CHLR|nr:DUF6094 domain-containing protein [Thermogemmatispora tikiterensis]RAQ95939.1 hypothetical protein A4R35_10370 [Thermogemmatispora tikiterensis]